MDFEEAERGILDREETRSRKAAQEELARWRENFEHGTEIRVLKKILKDTGNGGGYLASLIKDFSQYPHPLSAFTRDDPNRLILVRRCMKMVRVDYEWLLARAGERAGRYPEGEVPPARTAAASGPESGAGAGARPEAWERIRDGDFRDSLERLEQSARDREQSRPLSGAGEGGNP